MKPERFALAAWCAGLALAAWVLHLLGTGDLAAPPGPAGWMAWVDEVGAPAAVVAVVRQLAVVAVWYLVVVTVVGAVMRRVGSDRGVQALDAVTPRLVRRFLASAAGLVVSTAGLAAAVSPLAANVDVDTPALAADEPSASSAEPGSEITLRRVDPPPAEAPDAGTATLAPLDFQLAPLGSQDPVPVAPEIETWQVTCGDHFWSIAEETLAEAWGRAVTDAEIDGYWQTLIAANEDRLVAPGNPDLLLPGQVLVLPDPGDALGQTAGV